ncbi:unnamed protein product, partial [Adineta ricciae]
MCSPTFQLVGTYSTGFNAQPNSIVTADFNRDGHVDLAFGNQEPENIGVLLGNNDGTFTAQTTFLSGYSTYARLLTR